MDMFQPQASPYSPFSSYGAVPDFYSYQASPSRSSYPKLAVDARGPAVVQGSNYAPAPVKLSPASFDGNNTNSTPPQFKMSPTSNEINDLDRQEELARSFRPDLRGPLVGEKRSSHAITEEYAKADPVYIAKTAVSTSPGSVGDSYSPGVQALPQKYSHYRPILGDGNCGWRATGFAYFESLVRSQDKSQLEEEIARMTSLDNFLTTVGGFQSWIFEDMVEETTNLLRDLAASLDISPGAAQDVLIQRFNNPDVSDSIVYHLRLLASSCLKGSPASYQDFIPDNLGIEGYCKAWLEPPNQEIDHLGMTLLIDILLKPIGIAVEIVYLDRSEGSQVNSHLIQSEDEDGIPTNPSGPIIHLLYRPSHYDILYKDAALSRPLQQAIHEASQNQNIQVNRATSFSQPHTLRSTPVNDFTNMDLLLSIPGFHCPPPSHHGFSSQYNSPIEQTYAASPMSASLPPASPGTHSNAASSNNDVNLSTNFPLQQSSNLASPTVGTPHSSHTPFPPQTMQLPLHPGVPPQVSPPTVRPSLPSRSSQHSDLPSPTSANSPFRPSRWELDARVAEKEGPVVFQTSTFKNSHYNIAHYNNPNFQPEEWNPEHEDASGGQVGGGGGRKRST